jgi:hypothetical protein
MTLTIDFQVVKVILMQNFFATNYDWQNRAKAFTCRMAGGLQTNNEIGY